VRNLLEERLVVVVSELNVANVVVVVLEEVVVVTEEVEVVVLFVQFVLFVFERDFVVLGYLTGLIVLVRRLVLQFVKSTTNFQGIQVLQVAFRLAEAEQGAPCGVWQAPLNFERHQPR